MWLGAAAALFAALAVAAPAASALPADFWGVSPQATPTLEQFQRLRAGGVGSVRIGISWNAVQPLSGGETNF
ncbi:MAG: hypothetical protein ACLGG5_00475, partial [Thermoleophilia bacterium]